MRKPQPPRDLWEQMDSIVGDPIKDDPGISATEFAERYRINTGNAARRLRTLVAEGKLIEGKRKAASGHFERVYRPK